MSPYSPRRNSAGYTILEVLVTIAFMALLTKFAISNIKSLQNPLADASFEVSHFLRLVRSRAISQTLAIKVAPLSSTRIGTSKSTTCTGTMTAISDLTLTLPNQSSLPDTTWSVCFTPRGLAATNITFQILGRDGRSKTVEIALGGGVQIQ